MRAFNHPSPLGTKELFNETKTVYDPTLGYDRNIMPSPPYLTYQQLQVTSTGNVLTAPEIEDSVSVHDVVASMVQTLVSQLDARRTPVQRASFLSTVRATAAAVVGMRSVTTPIVEARASAVDVSTLIQHVAIAGEGRCNVSMAVSVPTRRREGNRMGHNGKAAAVVYVTGPPAVAPSAGYHDERVAALNKAGYTVVRPVLCGLEKGGVYDIASTKSTSVSTRAQGAPP